MQKTFRPLPRVYVQRNRFVFLQLAGAAFALTTGLLAAATVPATNPAESKPHAAIWIPAGSFASGFDKDLYKALLRTPAARYHLQRQAKDLLPDNIRSKWIPGHLGITVLSGKQLVLITLSEASANNVPMTAEQHTRLLKEIANALVAGLLEADRKAGGGGGGIQANILANRIQQAQAERTAAEQQTGGTRGQLALQLDLLAKRRIQADEELNGLKLKLEETGHVLEQFPDGADPLQLRKRAGILFYNDPNLRRYWNILFDVQLSAQASLDANNPNRTVAERVLLAQQEMIFKYMDAHIGMLAEQARANKRLLDKRIRVLEDRITNLGVRHRKTEADLRRLKELDENLDRLQAQRHVLIDASAGTGANKPRFPVVLYVQ